MEYTGSKGRNSMSPYNGHPNETILDVRDNIKYSLNVSEINLQNNEGKRVFDALL